MGDRTNVTLTILTTHVNAAEKIIDDYKQKYNCDLTTEYEFTEINYGTLEFIDSLIEAGIPFISRWADGDEYGSGKSICRFDDKGEIQLIETHDADKNPDIAMLMAIIDKPIELRQYIVNHSINVTNLPWDNQETNSKIYLTKQLIAGK